MPDATCERRSTVPSSRLRLGAVGAWGEAAAEGRAAGDLGGRGGVGLTARPKGGTEQGRCVLAPLWSSPAVQGDGRAEARGKGEGQALG